MPIIILILKPLLQTGNLLVILCHGFGGERTEAKRFPPLSDKLLKNGFNSIQFDFSGSGA